VLEFEQERGGSVMLYKCRSDVHVLEAAAGLRLGFLHAPDFNLTSRALRAASKPRK
jgi:hypothetical protein